MSPGPDADPVPENTPAYHEGDVSLIPALTTPRSLDLAHLRTAAWFHRRDPIHDFVTRDDTQGQAAREIGLPVR